MADGLTLITFLLALSGGLLPALIWLWFWLKEDKHPEPRKLLILTFLVGMLMTFVALPLEHFVLLIEKWLDIEKTFLGIIILLLSWAFIEEYLKYFAANKTALKRKVFDEPVDALIYLITAALGFAAMENILFLVNVFGTQGFIPGVITSDLRFIGATLLHIATSAIVGASIAFSFFHKENRKRNVIGGIFIATVLHFVFNYFIIKSEATDMFKILIPLWLVIIILILIFEKVKKIKEPRQAGRL